MISSSGGMSSRRGLLIATCLAGLVAFTGIRVAGRYLLTQRVVYVQIRLAAPIPGGVQVYYCTRLDEAYSDERYIPLQEAGTPEVMETFIPASQLWRLRFDFGSVPGDFTILGGMVGDKPLPTWDEWTMTSDIQVKSPLRETGELKLFSKGNDPNMFVTFRRPIQSVGKLNRKRFKGFVLAGTLALALVLALVGTLSGRTGKEGSAKVAGTFSKWVCLPLIMIFFFFVGIKMASFGCDYRFFHVAEAENLNFHDLLRPIKFWKQHFYPMWHLLTKFIKVIFHLKSSVLAAGLANGICYNSCLIGIYVFLRRHFRNVNPCGLVGLAFAVCTVGCMLGPWVNLNCLYEHSHNSWHNPTNTMVKTLALPCVLLTVRIINRQFRILDVQRQVADVSVAPGWRDRGQWSQILVLGFALVLTELAKPSFVQVYLPAVLLFYAGWFLANRKSFLAFLQTSLALIAPCLVVLAQYMLAFESGGGGGVGFGFMKAVAHYKYYGLSHFYAVVFPVAALMAAMLRKTVHTEDIFCWIMLLVGMIMRYTLFECDRASDGNFGWGFGVALYLVWVTGVRQYVDLAISQNSLRCRLGFWALSALLFLHLLTGFFRMYDMMCLGRGI